MKIMIRELKERIKLLFKPFSVKIKSGPLKNTRFVLSTGIRFLQGNYEEYKTKAFIEHLKANDIVFDIGTHVGYYSLLSAKLVGPNGKVFSFEPRPLNIEFIKQHIKINKIKNIELFEVAVGSYSGECTFEARTGTGTGHVSESGNMKLKIISLDEMYQSKKLPKPNFIKIDVEGGESEVLKGTELIISTLHPKILIATHGESNHNFVLYFLEKYNYHYRILDKGDNRGDIEIIAW